MHRCTNTELMMSSQCPLMFISSIMNIMEQIPGKSNKSDSEKTLYWSEPCFCSALKWTHLLFKWE